VLWLLLPAGRLKPRLVKQIPSNADVTDASTMSLVHEPLPPIRVLIADDSAMMRNELTRMLDSSPLMRVCGSARDGPEVVEKTKLLQPDVITLDFEMPLLNGVEALKRIMCECPCPVIMFSSSSRKGAEVTLEALSAGAFDYLPKIRPGVNALQTAGGFDRESRGGLA
jgi:chemotaxis response regulator CheB